MPLEEEETTILQLYAIAERLTNVVQKHSAEAFRQINDRMEGFWLVTLFADVFGDEILGGRPDKSFDLLIWRGCCSPGSSRSGRHLRHDRDCHRAHNSGGLGGARRETRSLLCFSL